MLCVHVIVLCYSRISDRDYEYRSLMLHEQHDIHLLGTQACLNCNGALSKDLDLDSLGVINLSEERHSADARPQPSRSDFITWWETVSRS